MEIFFTNTITPLLTTFSLLFGGAQVASAAGAVDLRPMLNPVRSQGGVRNLCSAFEAATLAEFLIFKTTGKQVVISENYNYWAAKTRTLTTPYLQDAYGHVDGMAGFLAVEALQQGVMLESSWPYC